jgi:hypothetical protein
MMIRYVSLLALCFTACTTGFMQERPCAAGGFPALEGEHVVAYRGDNYRVAAMRGAILPDGENTWPENWNVALWVRSLRDAGNVTRVDLGRDGRFALSLPPGQYCVKASALGYEPAVVKVTVGNDSNAHEFTMALQLAY